MVKRPVDPAGGVENPEAPDRSAASLREGFPHLLGRARPAHRLHRRGGGLFLKNHKRPPLRGPASREVGGSTPARSRSDCQGSPRCRCLPVEGDFKHGSRRCVPNGTRTTTREGVCSPEAFSETRRLASILLACLWLRACRCTCRADAGFWEVDGSDPPFRGPGSGAGCRSRPNYLCGKAVEPMKKPALAFPLWTAANLISRALWRNRWYRRTFPAYPPRGHPRRSVSRRFRSSAATASASCGDRPALPRRAA